MERKIRIDPFLNDEGKITQLPRRQALRLALLAYISDRFEYGRTYTEPQINVICEDCQTFGDIFLLRRELVDHGFLSRTRDGAQYWRTPDALTAKDDNPTL